MSTPFRQLAEAITRDLFTAYKSTQRPIHCDQIWLYRDRKEVAGWCETPMADAIEKHLAEALEIKLKEPQP